MSMPSEPDVSALLTVQQAIGVIDAVPAEPRVERRALLDAQGLRLAQNLVSDRDYPPFDKSLMDGYAVRVADVSHVPVEMCVTGEVAAGQWPERAVGAGEAIAVMTGAPLPAGADGVVPVEHVEQTAQGIRVLRAASPGRYIGRRGSDAPAGQVVLARGQLLEAPQLAVAASVGAAEVDVYARPRVGVLTTGDELVALGETPGAAQIRNSNNVMLVALLRRLGCEVTDLGTARDEPVAVREALARGFAYDALFVTGGMSMGAYDYVPGALVGLGVDLKITKLRIKPGKPFVFGVARCEACVLTSGAEGGMQQQVPVPSHFCHVFGLPGNPVSAFICTLRLASRLLTRLAGGVVEERWLSGRLDVGLPANGPREFYQPVVRSAPAGAKSAQNEIASIRPLAYKGSADLFTLAHCNALLVRPENEPALAKGTLVRVLEM